GDVLAVLDELDRETRVRALVVADAEALDELPRLQAERLGTREDRGFEVGRHGLRCVSSDRVSGGRPDAKRSAHDGLPGRVRLIGPTIARRRAKNQSDSIQFMSSNGTTRR